MISRNTSYKRVFPFVKYAKNKCVALILVYHRVLPVDDPYTMASIRSDQFERQMRTLRKFYNVISLDQLYHDYVNKVSRSNSVCITFDDGYRDNYNWAFPVLKRYDLPATIFLTSDFIDTDKLLWHDRVLNAIENTDKKKLKFERSDSPIFDLENNRSKIDSKYEILKYLKQFNSELRNELLDFLVNILDVSNIPSKYKMLTWTQIREMAKYQIYFGSHTCTHPILSTVSDMQLHHEIIKSKEIIEKNLGNPIVTFAYPNGKTSDYDERAVHLLKKSGYDCAVTTVWGVNNKTSDPYQLKRISTIEYDTNHFNSLLQFEFLK